VYTLGEHAKRSSRKLQPGEGPARSIFCRFPPRNSFLIDSALTKLDVSGAATASPVE